MTLLGIDTSTPAAAACVLRSDGQAFEVIPPAERLERPPAHASELLPAVADAMDRAAVDWGDLDAIAVGVGPGTFTGLRIGVATARALGSADTAALGALDAGLARELKACGRAPWQVLAGAAEGDAGLSGALLHEDAPYGVGYVVATWS